MLVSHLAYVLGVGYSRGDLRRLLKVLHQGLFGEHRGQELLESDGPVLIDAGAVRQTGPPMMPGGRCAAAYEHGVLGDVLALKLVRAGAQDGVGGHGRVVFGLVVGDEHGGGRGRVFGGGVLQLDVV